MDFKNIEFNKIKKKKVMNIVKPPILTIGDLWIFLESGKSKILNLKPKLFTSGPNANPNKQQVNILKKIISIQLVFRLKSTKFIDRYMLD